MSGLQSHYLSSTVGDVHSTKDETEIFGFSIAVTIRSLDRSLEGFTMGTLSQSLFIPLIALLVQSLEGFTIALLIQSLDPVQNPKLR